MPHSTAEHNLLFGIIALQMDFVGRDELIEGMHSWVLKKSRTLGEILSEKGFLSSEHWILLDALVMAHLKRHGGDPQKSLAAVSSIKSVRQELDRLADADVAASLVHVAANAPLAADSFATRDVTLGVASSVGTRFRILRPHASGGLGQVSVALDEELHREVALKEIQPQHADSPSSRLRFLLEAEVTGQLEHPGIVPVYGLGAYADHRPFYAMRFVRGDSLKTAIEHFHRENWTHRRAARRLQLRRLIGRFIDVCNAISYAHSRGVLHRDLKPGNIMLGNYGETLVVDWGLAKLLGRPECISSTEPPLVADASGSSETILGTAIGTPQYMSPEQAAGRIDLLGAATDVYSLGATLYHVLAGRPPFPDADIGDVLARVTKGDFPPPRQAAPDIPRSLEAVCLKAMALRPEDRYGSPRRLADDLEHWLADEPVGAYREPLLARAGRFARRHRAGAQAAAAAMFLITVVSVAAAFLIDVARNRAEQLANANAALALQERASKEGARAIKDFYEDYVLVAARPKGWSGGAGAGISLREALDEAVPKVGEAFAGQAELEASVSNTLGMTYRHLTQYEQAEPLLERAYAVRAGRLGPDDPETLGSQHELSMLRWKQNRLKEAIALARDALTRRRRALGPEHEDTLFTQLNLGLYLSEDGQYAEAEKVLTAGVEICTRALGPDHHHTLYGQNDLALVLGNRGKVHERVALNRVALAGRTRSLGPDHPDTLRSMGNLAWALQAVGQLDEAERLARESLDLRIKVLGDAHEETQWSRQALGDTLDSKGLTIAAEKVFRESADVCRRLRPADDPVTLNALFNLGYCLRAQRKHEESVSIFREAAEGSRRTLGAEDSLTLYREYQLAWALQSAGKIPEAEALYKSTLDAQIRTRGPDHPKTLSSKNGLAVFLVRQGKYIEAEKLFRELAEAAARTGDRSTTWYRRNLATSLDDAGKFDEAEGLLRQVADAYARELSPDHEYTLDTQRYLADLLVALDRGEEAEILYRRVFDVRQKTLGKVNVKTLAVSSDIGWMLGWRGEVERGEAAHAEVLDAIQVLFGASPGDSAEAEKPRAERGDLVDLQATTLAHLGRMLLDYGRPSEAESHFRRRWELRRLMDGADHPDTLLAQVDLAAAVASQGKLEDARPLFQVALERQKALLGASHIDVATTLAAFGERLTDNGGAAEAEPLLRECLTIRASTCPPKHWTMGAVQSLLGACLTRLDRRPEAESLLLRGHEILQTSAGARPRVRYDSFDRLASYYAANNRATEAASCRAEAERFAKRFQFDRVPKTAATLEN